MASVGELTTTFDARRRVVPIEIAAAVLGAIVAGDHWILAFCLIAVGVLSSSRERAQSTTSEFVGLIERVALACLIGALIAPPLALWVTSGVVAVGAVILCRLTVDLWNDRPNRAWTRGLATVLVGNEDDVRRAAQLFATHPEHRVRPVASVTPTGVPTVLPNGRIADLAAIVAEHRAEHVLVVTSELGDEVVQLFGLRRPEGVRLSVLPPMAQIMTAGAQMVDVRGLPFLSLAPRRRPSGPAWIAKRAIDLVGTAVGLVVVLPVFVVTAVAILIDSGRPVFFRQRRVGRDGKHFDLWKFRTMVVDAEALLPELMAANEAEGPFFKIENDPRVTRVGGLLRRLSIDELPQLFNVLRGDMSLVGPRPFLPSEMESDPELFEWRLPFMPGITGLWQVAGRSWLSRTDGLRMDLSYVENWRLGLDVRILLRTASAAVRGDRRPSVIAAASTPALTRARYLGLVDGDDLHKTGEDCDLSIVIVTHESKPDIVDCLDSLRRLSDAVSREIIVVDNASHDGTADLIAAQYPEVRLIRKRRRDGFATNVNIGAVASSGRHIFLLNPDTSTFNGTLDRLVEHLDTHPDVGILGPRLVYPDGRLQASARRFPTPLNTIVRRTPLRRLVGITNGTRRHLMTDSMPQEVTEVDWLLGAAMAIRADAFYDLGGLDDGYRLYCEDLDACWRAHEAGWRVEQLPSAVVQHALGELTAKRFFTIRTLWHYRSMLRFVRLHGLGSLGSRMPVPSGVRRRPIGRVDLIDLIDLADVAPVLVESAA